MLTSDLIPSLDMVDEGPFLAFDFEFSPSFEGVCEESLSFERVFVFEESCPSLDGVLEELGSSFD